MELSSLTASVTLLPPSQQAEPPIFNMSKTYIKEFGFFFFLRIAVAVSDS